MTESATNNNTEQLQKLIDAGVDWSADREAITSQEINKWRFYTIITGVFSAALVLCLVLLLPLKKVDLQVIEHDRSTGRTEIMQKLDKTTLTQKDAVIRYQLNKYVLAYERYFHADHDERYADVAAMSSKAVYEEYDKEHTRKNESSLLNVLGEQAKIDVDIKSISELPESPGTWIVRFDKTLKYSKAGVRPQRVPYVGTYSIRFVNKERSKDELLRNPLGFEVVARQVTKEAV